MPDAKDETDVSSGFMCSALFSRNAAGQKIAVQFDDQEKGATNLASPQKKAKAQPAFLQGSHVGGQ